MVVGVGYNAMIISKCGRFTLKHFVGVYKRCLMKVGCITKEELDLDTDEILRKRSTSLHYHQKARKLFDHFDKDKSGFVDPEEFQAILEKLGMTVNAEETAMIFQTLDKDKSGDIDFEEFLEWYTDLKGGRPDEQDMLKLKLHSRMIMHTFKSRKNMKLSNKHRKGDGSVTINLGSSEGSRLSMTSNMSEVPLQPMPHEVKEI
jgi:hypothetical protein